MSPPKPLAYEAYQQLADDYAAKIETKPHNAYCERPAMLALWPGLEGRRVLDVGCGPGIYAELLSQRGAIVTAIDASERMLFHARKRLGPEFDLRQHDIAQPFSAFPDGEFDLVHAPLCLDYVEDWRAVFREFHRLLKPGGHLQFSCAHPAADAELHQTIQYHAVESVTYPWKGFGKPVVMPSYRRPWREVLMPLVENGFQLLELVEPKPTADFLAADPFRYYRVAHRPCFLCILAQR